MVQNMYQAIVFVFQTIIPIMHFFTYRKQDSEYLEKRHPQLAANCQKTLETQLDLWRGTL